MRFWMHVEIIVLWQANSLKDGLRDTEEKLERGLRDTEEKLETLFQAFIRRVACSQYSSNFVFVGMTGTWRLPIPSIQFGSVQPVQPNICKGS